MYQHFNNLSVRPLVPWAQDLFALVETEQQKEKKTLSFKEIKDLGNTGSTETHTYAHIRTKHALSTH